MGKINDRRHISMMISLCMAVYFVSYLTRVNYNAVLVEITAHEGFSKTAASMPLTGLFVSYGIGQLISGYLGDKFKPKFIIFIGLLTTTAMNLLLPFCKSIEAMTVVWCINGFAQSMLWPPLVKIMTAAFTPDVYKKACVKVSWSSSFGTIAVYLLAPVCISFSSWKTIFLICGAFSAVISFIWLSACTKMERYAEASDKFEEDKTSEEAQEKFKFSPQLLFIMITVMLAIVMQGILRDGLTAWMPAYISESFNISSSISVLTGVALPVFSIFCFQITEFLNRKVIRNEIVCAMTIFGVGALCSAALYLMQSGSPVFSVIMFTLITGCMHGVNLLLICMLPPYFAKYGKVSFISGLFNSCTYIGSAVSIYGIASVTEKSGWHTTISVWLVIAVCGTLFCAVCAGMWRKFTAKSK